MVNATGSVLLVLLRTGLRLGEALGLQWQDIDFERATLHVSRQWGSGGPVERVKWNSERTIELTRRTVDLLARMRRRDPRWIFVNPATDQPWSQKAIGDAFREVSDAAALPARHYTTHSLRHTYATRLLEITGDLRFVQQQLGHRSVKTTRFDLYARAARRPRPELLDQLDGAGAPGALDQAPEIARAFTRRRGVLATQHRRLSHEPGLATCGRARPPAPPGERTP